MNEKIKFIVAVTVAAFIIGGGGGLNSCTIDPSIDSPNEKAAEYLPEGMPDGLTVYGPIIFREGETHILKYKVKADFSGGTLSYNSGIDVYYIGSAAAQSVEALILQYAGTGAYGFGGTTGGTPLFNGFTNAGTLYAGSAYALDARGSAIIPLDTQKIKEQLTIVLSADPSAVGVSTGQSTPIIWIEDNKSGITVEGIETWGAGTYASKAEGIRIGGLSAGGSIDAAGTAASNVGNFDSGDWAGKKQPYSISTVLAPGGVSTINFYNAAEVQEDDVIISKANGSLGTASASDVKKWMAKDDSPKPAVSIIYEWKK
jgi:hypothetical protein